MGQEFAPGVFKGQNRRKVNNMFRVQKQQNSQADALDWEPSQSSTGASELSVPSLMKLG